MEDNDKRSNEKGLTGMASPFLEFIGSPSWARTNDLRINSPALYRLSYRGSRESRMIVSELDYVKVGAGSI